MVELFFSANLNGDRSHYVGKQTDLCFERAKGFDGLGKRNFPLIDLNAVIFFQRLCDFLGLSLMVSRWLL